MLFDAHFDSDVSMEIDLHCGPYSMFHLQTLRVPNFRQISDGVDGYTTLKQLRPEAALLLLIGHAFGHRHVTVRDLNDTFVLLHYSGGVDEDWLNYFIHENELEGVAIVLFSWVNWLYPNANIGRLSSFVKALERSPGWPFKFGWGKVFRQWWKYTRMVGTPRNQLHEMVTFGWAQLANEILMPAAMNSRNKYVSSCLNSLSEYRNSNVDLHYLSPIELLLDKYIPPLNIYPGAESLFTLNESTAHWDPTLGAVVVPTGHGSILILSCGIYLSTPTPLVPYELITRAEYLCEQCGQFIN